MTEQIVDRVEERLGALRDLEVLEARSEPELDGLASLAALACGTSMAAISFLDGEREWFKATVGFEAASLPMSQSLTRDLVAGSGDALIVSGEAIADRWPVHPLLTTYGVHFVAAAPLTTPEGIRVGAVMVLGSEPATLSVGQQNALHLLCRHVMDRLQLRRSNLLLSLLEQEDALRSLYTLTADAGLDLSEQLNRLLNFGCQLFGMDAGLIGHMTSTGYEIDEVYGPDVFPLRRGQMLDVENTFCAEVISSGQPAAIADVAGTVFSERQAYRDFGLQAYLGSPLIVDGTVYGCISFFGLAAHSRPFEAREVDLQNVMANWVSGRLARVRAEQERDAAYQARADFLARMSHEIRTPLHGVIGMVELLRSTPLDDEQAGLTNTLDVSAHALLDVINDVLDFSKLEAGKLTLEDARFELAAVVREAIEMIGPTAGAKGLRLRQQTNPGLPSEFVGDRTRIRQVLMNLVGNAVKYTPTGEVTVETAPRLDGGSGVEIRVRDTGIGIDPSRLAAIFEPFEQAESSTTRRFGGTGLGLSISLSLVKLMGGAIEVESEPGRGSVFRVLLPLPAWTEPTDSASAATPVSAAAAEALNIRRVLVVDDNETNRVIASRMLARLGIPSDLASDGESGVRAAAEGDYDLILMDISMPIMDGFQALRRIRDAGGLLPILAMTASVTPEERENCLRSGFNDILPKPFTLAQLTESLHRNAQTPEPPTGEDFVDDAIDFDRLDALLELDEPGEQSLLELFANEARTRLETLRGAAERADAAESRQAAHSLKGLSASVGAVALSSNAASVEQAGAAGTAVSAETVSGLATSLDRFLVIARGRRP